jgi:hypothetical protein
MAKPDMAADTPCAPAGIASILAALEKLRDSATSPASNTMLSADDHALLDGAIDRAREIAGEQAP